MSIARFLNAKWLKNMRDAAASIRAITFFATPIVGVAAFAYLRWGTRVFESEWTAPTVGVAVVTCAFLGGVVYCLRVRQRHVSYDATNISGLMHIEPFESNLKYTITRNATIRARHDGLRLVEFVWHWTGQGDKTSYEAKPTNPNHTLFDPRRYEEDHQFYRWVYLGKPLLKGQTEHVGVSTTIVDNITSMSPFYTEAVRGQRTDALRVTLRFRRDIDPVAVTAHVWRTDRPWDRAQMADLPFERVVASSGDYVDYVADVRKPSRNRRYGFRWMNED